MTIYNCKLSRSVLLPFVDTTEALEAELAWPRAIAGLKCFFFSRGEWDFFEVFAPVVVVEEE